MLLAVISAGLVQVALDRLQPGAGVDLLCVSAVLAVALGVVARRAGWSAWGGGAVVGVVSLAMLPLVWDPLSRAFVGAGAPYEVQLAYVLRNAMFGLAATPRLPRATQLATLASFFLVMFGFLWAMEPIAVALLIAYAIIGVWWLLAMYWDRLGGRFADSSERSIPLRPALAAFGILAVAAFACVPLASQSAVTTALAGFFPSSGGTQHNDPFALGGVGDGDQMVSAKDQASSFGPIDSELFLESKMPSLYDAFNEFSEPVGTKKKRMQRAIPLAASQVQMNHQKRGLTQQATREFSTVRQTLKRRPKTEDRLSAALLLVKGRVPMHLALESYDQWDGRSLIASAGVTPLNAEISDMKVNGRRWLNIPIARPTDLYKDSAGSQVRVVNLKTERVPTPAGVRRVTLDGLHAASMFKFAADGSLAMDVEHIPQLTIFDFQSALRDRFAQPQLALTSAEDGAGRVADLARQWTNDSPEGWPQVEAVVARLRQDYVHDSTAMVPEAADEAVEHFLFESKRGPDYLFAASAAVMLRSLGYDTRVRSGFYASPARYDRVARMTTVLAEDAHFWVEVLTSNGHRRVTTGESLPGVWVTVEPTPGFELLYAPETLWAWLSRVTLAACRSILAQPLLVGLVILGGGVLHAIRRRLIDAVLLVWWTIRSRTAEAGRLARLTLRLLEWRAWAYRQQRPQGTTLGKWEALRSQDDFIGLVSWSLYGAGAPSPLTTDAARHACRRAIRTPFPLRRSAQNHAPHRDTPTVEND